MHVHGVPCAAILLLLYIWKDLRVCLALESFCAGCAGLPSARHQRSGMTCLVRLYLLCCCGACSRRSLRCHTGAFIRLERFEGLSCDRKSFLVSWCCLLRSSTNSGHRQVLVQVCPGLSLAPSERNSSSHDSILHSHNSATVAAVSLN